MEKTTQAERERLGQKKKERESMREVLTPSPVGVVCVGVEKKEERESMREVLMTSPVGVVFVGIEKSKEKLSSDP